MVGASTLVTELEVFVIVTTRGSDCWLGKRLPKLMVGMDTSNGLVVGLGVKISEHIRAKVRVVDDTNVSGT
jgi:hypothetical protein